MPKKKIRHTHKKVMAQKLWIFKKFPFGKLKIFLWIIKFRDMMMIKKKRVLKKIRASAKRSRRVDKYFLDIRQQVIISLSLSLSIICVIFGRQIIKRDMNEESPLRVKLDYRHRASCRDFINTTTTSAQNSERKMEIIKMYLYSHLITFYSWSSISGGHGSSTLALLYFFNYHGTIVKNPSKIFDSLYGHKKYIGSAMKVMVHKNI